MISWLHLIVVRHCLLGLQISRIDLVRLQLMRRHGRDDLVDTVIAPASAEAAASAVSDVREERERVSKYLARLKEVRHNRSAMEVLLQHHCLSRLGRGLAVMHPVRLEQCYKAAFGPFHIFKWQACLCHNIGSMSAHMQVFVCYAACCDRCVLVMHRLLWLVMMMKHSRQGVTLMTQHQRPPVP